MKSTKQQVPSSKQQVPSSKQQSLCCSATQRTILPPLPHRDRPHVPVPAIIREIYQTPTCIYKADREIYQSPARIYKASQHLSETDLSIAGMHIQSRQHRFINRRHAYTKPASISTRTPKTAQGAPPSLPQFTILNAKLIILNTEFIIL